MNLSSSKGKKLILKAVLISVVFYIIFLFINQFIRIRSKKEEIKKIHQEILTEKSKNDKILDMLDEKESENSLGNSSNEEGSSRGNVRVFESVTR